MFVFKIHKELEVADGDSRAVVKFKRPVNACNSINTSIFVRKVQKTTDNDSRKSVNAIVKKLSVSRNSVGRIVQGPSIEFICDAERLVHACKDKR